VSPGVVAIMGVAMGWVVVAGVATAPLSLPAWDDMVTIHFTLVVALAVVKSIVAHQHEYVVALVW
jgi:hypothetical protein